MTPDEIGQLLQRHVFHFVDEEELRDGIAQVLIKNGIVHSRELVLSSRDRIDFFISPDVGLEVKVRASISDINRQLFRYAEHDRIRQLMLVTASARPGALLPSTIDGKPLTVVSLAGSAL